MKNWLWILLQIEKSASKCNGTEKCSAFLEAFLSAILGLSIKSCKSLSIESMALCISVGSSLLDIVSWISSIGPSLVALHFQPIVIQRASLFTINTVFVSDHFSLLSWSPWDYTPTKSPTTIGISSSSFGDKINASFFLAFNTSCALCSSLGISWSIAGLC